MNTMESDAQGRHPVLFVGAGPGDPELITVKGQKALAEADLVIFAGSLVPEALLQWTRPDTENISSASMNLEEIVAKIAAAYTDGRRVVRLHTGEPSLYGAIFEQISELSLRGIAYKIIPGVTAAFAAAASLGIEYTLPEVSQTLILTRMAGRTPVPETENLASLAAHRASMAIYLSIQLIDQVGDILASAYGPEAGCAIVYRASQPEERIVYAPLGKLAETVKKENITHQALVVVAKAIEMRETVLTAKSRLYDRSFAHGYRKAQQEG